MKTQPHRYSGILILALISNVSISQNVGIGTSVPAEKLHVVGTVRSTALAGVGSREVLADANGTLTVGTIGTAPDWTILGNSNIVSATNFIGTTNNVDFRIRTNNTERIIVTGAGNIGLFYNTPANYVHFRRTGTAAVWQTLWENLGTTDAVMQVYNTNTGNGSRVLMGVTNYNAAAFAASAVMGLSLNNAAGNFGGEGVRGYCNSIDAIGVFAGSVIGTGAGLGWSLLANGWAGGPASWVTTSDARIKKDVKTIGNAMKKISQLRGVEYYYNTVDYPDLGLASNTKQLGFVADEVEKIFPEIVREANIPASPGVMTAESSAERKNYLLKTMTYSSIIPVLVEAMKEQQQMIDKLNERIAALEKMNITK